MAGPIAIPGRRADVLAVGLILVVVGLYVLASTYFGAPALGIIALVAGTIIVLRGPALALGLLMVPTILFEDSAEGGFLPGLNGFYEGSVVSPFEGLLALAVIATILDVARRGDFRLPDPLTLPLLLTAIAVASGVLVANGNGVPVTEAMSTARPMLPLLLLPFVVVNVLRDRESIRRLLIVMGLLVGLKAGLGIVSVIVGQGYANPGDPPLTYLEPTINWLSITVILVVVARILQRERPPLWLIAVGLLSCASLLLSYRRSFWIAVIVALLIVIVVGLEGRRWQTLLPVVIIVVFASWLTLGTGAVGELQGPIAERALSLNPTKLQHDPQDSYRIGERRNVIAEIEDHPFTGLGLAVPWIARYPLSIDRPFSRSYVHFGALWWWLKLGLLGFLAYLAVMGSSIWASFLVWREQSEAWFRAFGLAMLGSVIGLVMAETTASFTGVTPRMSAVFATAVGIVAAMLAESRRAGLDTG